MEKGEPKEKGKGRGNGEGKMKRDGKEIKNNENDEARAWGR